MRETTVKTLALLVDGEIVGNPDRRINNVANLTTAGEGDISFLNSDRYADSLGDTDASAVLVRDEKLKTRQATLIVVKNPYLAYAKVAAYLAEEADRPKGVHASAVVHETALVHNTAYIGPNVCIEAGAVIEEGVYIAANVFIGKQVKIGKKTTINANVVVYAHTEIGHDVLLHGGCVLGADGFGFANDEGRWVKIPQLGRLIIGNDVEIGANSTIDRGAIDNTIIHDGVKIDNLVHIGHNAEVGDHTAMAAFVGISGSTRIGKYCTLGGASGYNGHINIVDNVHVGAMGMVTKSLTKSGSYASGIPAEETSKWRRNVARFRQIEKLEKRIIALESELKLIKGS